MTSQELADTRTCLVRLDTILDEQMNTLRAVPTSSKAAFAEPYVFTSKCIIREEVEKARRGAGSSTFELPCVGLILYVYLHYIPFLRCIPFDFDCVMNAMISSEICFGGTITC